MGGPPGPPMMRGGPRGPGPGFMGRGGGRFRHPGPNPEWHEMNQFSQMVTVMHCVHYFDMSVAVKAIA